MIVRQIKARQVRRHGKLCWLVRIPRDLRGIGPGIRHFGADKPAAERFAASLRNARTSLGSEFLKLTNPEQALLLNLLHEFGANGIAAGMNAWRGRVQAQKPLAAAVAEFLQIKREQNLSPVHVAMIRSTLNRMVLHLGDRQLETIKADEISQWVQSGDWKPKTRLNYLKAAQNFFDWAVTREWLLKNPCRQLLPPKVDYKPRPVLPPEDWAKILRQLRRDDPALLGYLCPVLFGGLRAAESARLTWANLRGGIIDLDSGKQTKLNRRRVVQMSEQLQAWMALPGVAVGGTRQRDRLAAAAQAAGVPWKKNCHRYSFCSYMLELKGATWTARAANHSEAMLYQHYAHKVTAEAAAAYAALRPETTAPPA